MKTIIVRNINATVDAVRPKPKEQYRKKVESIILDVQKRKDKALKEYEKKFSGAKLRSFRVTKSEIKDAYSKVTKEQIAAIKIAKKRLERTESALKSQLQNITIKIDGIKIIKVFVPLERVGCYIPGGGARYPSTAMMSIVPAKIAGVKKIIAVSPPNKNGLIDPLTLVVADLCGVDEFYKTGGAQAIAALAYGTESIPKVDKIVGPGGSFVTLAKLIVNNTVSIDMIAGPTELAIIADSAAEADVVASDLISQAEHSPETMCCLITTSTKLKDFVIKSVEQKIRKIQRRKIVMESLSTNGFVAICKTESDVIEFANKLAPEHLEIITKNPQRIAQKITSAGLVLIGKNTPSSASDYLLGSNHILPTSGFGRARGSLGVLDYMKIQSKIESSKMALQKISKYMKSITSAEGLPNHYEAVRIRLK
ncbi:MAG TPA: histidinol dehydrogenase [Nitrosopumilaceae archaeon]|nr:histidinol dehydrogenase [Nitrosopumilaceae archaeon]